MARAVPTMRVCVWIQCVAVGALLLGLRRFVHDATGSYTPSFAFAALSLAFAWSLFRLATTPRGR